MSTNDKDFIINDGLLVNGTATLSSGMTINNTLISINDQTNRLQAYVNGSWLEMALMSDIVPADISTMSLNIEYEGGN